MYRRERLASTPLTVMLLVTVTLLVAAVVLAMRGGGGTGGTERVGLAADSSQGVTVSCPTVADKLTDVPAAAQAEVSQNLDDMQREMADADARIAGLTGSEGGPEFIGNAILGPLTSRRVAAIDRIAIAIGRNAQRPTGLEVLAPCTLVS